VSGAVVSLSRVAIVLLFAPGDYVTVTVLGVNYRGRVSDITIKQGLVVGYSVNYVDDAAKLQNDTFWEDELTLTADMPRTNTVGFQPE
jgi:hypothetical protein